MPTRRSSSVLVLPLLALALVVPGCGGGGGDKGTSKADYEKQVRSLGTAFRSQVNATRAKVSKATTVQSRLDALDEFKQEFSSFADKIDKIKPPSGAQDEQDAVVASFRKGADDIGAVENAVKAKNAARIRSTAQTFQSDASDVQAALQKLRDAVK